MEEVAATTAWLSSVRNLHTTMSVVAQRPRFTKTKCPYRFFAELYLVDCALKYFKIDAMTTSSTCGYHMQPTPSLAKTPVNEFSRRQFRKAFRFGILLNYICSRFSRPPRADSSRPQCSTPDPSSERLEPPRGKSKPWADPGGTPEKAPSYLAETATQGAHFCM